MNDLDPDFLGSTPIFHGELFPRPADQIKIWDFLSGNPIKRIPLKEDFELFKFLDSPEITDDISHLSTKSQSKPTDTRRIYSLKYDHNNPITCTHVGLIIGIISLLYYVTLIKI